MPFSSATATPVDPHWSLEQLWLDSIALSPTAEEEHGGAGVEVLTDSEDEVIMVLSPIAEEEEEEEEEKEEGTPAADGGNASVCGSQLADKNGLNVVLVGGDASEGGAMEGREVCSPTIKELSPMVEAELSPMLEVDAEQLEVVAEPSPEPSPMLEVDGAELKHMLLGQDGVELNQMLSEEDAELSPMLELEDAELDLHTGGEDAELDLHKVVANRVLEFADCFCDEASQVDDSADADPLRHHVALPRGPAAHDDEGQLGRAAADAVHEESQGAGGASPAKVDAGHDQGVSGQELGVSSLQPVVLQRADCADGAHDDAAHPARASADDGAHDEVQLARGSADDGAHDAAQLAREVQLARGSADNEAHDAAQLARGSAADEAHDAALPCTTATETAPLHDGNRDSDVRADSARDLAHDGAHGVAHPAGDGADDAGVAAGPIAGGRPSMDMCHIMSCRCALFTHAAML